MHRHLILWLGFLGLTMLWSCVAPAAEFIDVSELLTDGYSIDNPGSMYISGDGSTLVGQRVRGFASSEAFRWSEADGEMGLGFFESSRYSLPDDISTDGSTIVGSSGQPVAFRWSEAEGMIEMGSVLDVEDGHFWSSAAHGVSGDGSTIVGETNSGREVGNEIVERDTRAFRWTEAEGGMGLGVVPGRLYSSAWDVSADGSTVVGMSGNGSAELGHEAFIWTEAGGMVGLGDLPGGEHASWASGMSADGSTVVGYGTTESGQEAFRWTAPEGMVMLRRPEGIETRCHANAVSADGSIIVGACNVPGDGPARGSEPVIWDALGGMRLLRDVLIDVYGLEAEVTGWNLTSAQSISDDGTVIVGWGLNPSITGTAWIAKIPEILEPVPGDFDGDRQLTAADIDRLSAKVLEGTHPIEYDLTDDGLVDGDDRTQWVEALKYTYFGDANLDGEFSSKDFVSVFQTGEYEDSIAGNSGLADGDWSGDTEFTSRDFVVAFQRGGYEQGAREQAKAVPEPAGWLLIGFGLLIVRACCRSHRCCSWHVHGK